MSKSQLKFIHGPFLDQICEKVGVRPTRGNKNAIKAVFKAFAQIETLGKMDDDTDFSLNIRRAKFISNTAWLLSAEAAIEVDLPNEYDVENTSMEDFLKMIYDKD